MTIDIVIPTALIDERQALLEKESARMRKELKRELEAYVKAEFSSLPTSIKNMTMRDFLQLLDFTAIEPPKSAVKRKRDTLVDKSDIEEDNRDTKRRVTRSMARSSSIYVGNSSGTASAQVPATPKLHPLLPETPAILRKAIRLEKAAREESNTDQASALDFKKPVRITRSTIRVIRGDTDPNANDVFKAPVAPTSRRSMRPSKVGGKTAAASNAIAEDVSTVSVELSDGQVLDINLAESPKSMLKGLGTEAVKEVRAKIQTYAAQLRSLFKKLNF